MVLVAVIIDFLMPSICLPNGMKVATSPDMPEPSELLETGALSGAALVLVCAVDAVTGCEGRWFTAYITAITQTPIKPLARRLRFAPFFGCDADALMVAPHLMQEAA